MFLSKKSFTIYTVLLAFFSFIAGNVHVNPNDLSKSIYNEVSEITETNEKVYDGHDFDKNKKFEMVCLLATSHSELEVKLIPSLFNKLYINHLYNPHHAILNRGPPQKNS